MIRKIITILLILIITNVNADENKILSIDVTGTQRIDIETVISYAKIEIGEYNDDHGNNALKKPNTNLFSNIEILITIRY